MLKEARDYVKPLWPDRLGQTCATTKITEYIQKFSKYELLSVTRKYEGGIASNRKSKCYGELVIGFRTHCPSRSGS